MFFVTVEIANVQIRLPAAWLFFNTPAGSAEKVHHQRFEFPLWLAGPVVVGEGMGCTLAMFRIMTVLCTVAMRHDQGHSRQLLAGDLTQSVTSSPAKKALGMVDGHQLSTLHRNQRRFLAS
jgi:hypothetical protein